MGEWLRRDVRQPSVYGFRYALEHRWRMVAVAVDVLWDISGFGKRFVGSGF